MKPKDLKVGELVLAAQVIGFVLYPKSPLTVTAVNYPSPAIYSGRDLHNAEVWFFRREDVVSIDCKVARVIWGA